MVPMDDGFEVRQIKRFVGRVEASERRQIERSWRTLCANPRLSRPIKAYRLVIPVDPTDGEQEWFDQLVEGAPWPVTWWGEVHWHDLATRHPHVIDYFFGGGRERIAQRSRALQSAVVDPTRPLTANDVVRTLSAMQTALNRDDPHYRYDLRSSTLAPSRRDLRNYVFAESRELADGGYLTILVAPKHLYSLQDAPIYGNFTVEIPLPELATQFREAFAAFEHFGRALDLPDGMVSGTLFAPGGLGGEFEGGSGWIGPVATEDFQPIRLVAVNPTGDVLGELPLEVTGATSGRLGGAEIHVADATNLLTGVLQIRAPNDRGERAASFSVIIGDLWGRAVMKVLPVVRVLSHLHPPNELELRPEYGNKPMMKSRIDRDCAQLTHDGLNHLEDLGILQRYTEVALEVPEEIESSFATELRHHVRMMKGEFMTGTWDEILLHLRSGIKRDDLLAILPHHGALAVDREMSVDFDGHEIDLGKFTTILHSVQVADEQPTDMSLLKLVPSADVGFTQRAGPVAPR